MLSFPLSFFISFIISFASLPTIIRIAGNMHLYDEPNERKLHEFRTPLLGGVAVFAATLFSFTICAAPFFGQKHIFIITSLILIFFFGLRDDIAPLAPLKKLSGQLAAASIVILFCDIRLTSLHGLFGIHSISYAASLIITVITIIFIVNSYNLIDGIDGLSSGLGVIASFSFAALFYAYDDMLMTVLAISLCGSLIGFLPFNFYKAKIFLGDTGTMTIGFILSIFAIHFIQLTRNINLSGWFDYRSAPVIVFAILVIPLIDTVRVFTLRILNRRSPFAADRNHIHHRLLAAGLRPPAAAGILFFVNLVFIFSAWYFRNADSTIVLYSLIFSAVVLTLLPDLRIRLKNLRQIA